jgi:hypothetical protein
MPAEAARPAARRLRREWLACLLIVLAFAGLMRPQSPGCVLFRASNSL